MCSSETTQKTEFEQPTAAEIKQMQMLEQLSGMMMQESGYVQESVPGTKESNPKWQDLQNKIEQAKKSPDPFGTMGAVISELQKQQNELPDGPAQTKLVKKSKAVQAMEQQYGKGSAQAIAQQEKELATSLEQEGMKDEITKKFMENTLKYVSGDFSINDKQKEQIAEIFAPHKALIEKSFGTDMSFEDVNKVVSDFEKGANESGLGLDAAVGAVGAQILRTGKSMEDALKDTISTHQKLLDMNIQDTTGEMTRKVNEQAAAMGRDPTDPEFQNEIQQTVSREIARGQAELGGMEAQAKIGIKERTGAGLEDVTRQRAAQQMGVQEAATNLRMQAASGSIPSQVGLGMNVAQFQDALTQQRFANMGQVPTNLASMYRQERLAGGTTTSKQKGSPLSMLLGLGSAAGSIYGGISQAGGYSSMADYYKGLASQ